MNLHKISDVALKVACGLFLALSLALTFTVSDYYIFNRFTKFLLPEPMGKKIGAAAFAACRIP